MSGESSWSWLGRTRSSRKPELVDVSSSQNMPAWPDYHYRLVSDASQPLPPPDTLVLQWLHRTRQQPIAVNDAINSKVKLWKGDITTLKVDAVVNAANGGMWAGGGICGAIHAAAGPGLEKESVGWVNKNRDVATGETLVTKAYNLPARFVFHTVGPRNGSAKKLQQCYSSCLELLLEHDCRSIAFCCVATGIFGFDNTEAAVVALDTVRSWLERQDRRSAVNTIVFCCFTDKDLRIYQRHMPLFFPCGDVQQPQEREAEEITEVKKPAEAEVKAETETEAVEKTGEASDAAAEKRESQQQLAAPAADGGGEADLMQVSRGDTIMTRVKKPAEDSKL